MDFPSKLYVKVIETGEEVYCGAFTVTERTSVEFGRAMLFKLGSATGSIRISVYGDSDRTETLAVSEWSDLTEIADFGSGNWLGKVRLAFTEFNLSPNHTVYITAEMTGYTRNGDVDYIGLALDWPLEVNDNTGTSAGLLVELYGNR